MLKRKRKKEKNNIFLLIDVNVDTRGIIYCTRLIRRIRVIQSRPDFPALNSETRVRVQRKKQHKFKENFFFWSTKFKKQKCLLHRKIYHELIANALAVHTHVHYLPFIKFNFSLIKTKQWNPVSLISFIFHIQSPTQQHHPPSSLCISI
jgi:hypothetical protein